MHAYLRLLLLPTFLVLTILILLPSTHADPRVIPLCGPILTISSTFDTFNVDLVLSSPTSTGLYGGFAEGNPNAEIAVTPCICIPPCNNFACGSRINTSPRISSVIVIGQNNSNSITWNSDNAETVKTMQYTLKSRTPGTFSLSWYFNTDDTGYVITNITVNIVQGPAPLPTPRSHYPLRGTFADIIRKTTTLPPPSVPPAIWVNDDLRKIKVWNLTSSTSTYVPTGLSLAKSYTKSAWVFRVGNGFNLHLMSSASAMTDTTSFPPTIHYLRVPPPEAGAGAAGHGKYDNTAVGVGAALASFISNGWNHVVVTYDTASRYLALYINGIPTRDSKLINTGKIDPWNGGDEILLSSATLGFVGRLSDVMYWDLALSADQVAQLYQDQLNPATDTTAPPTTQAPTTTSKPTTTTAPTTSTPTSTLKPTTTPPSSTTSPPSTTSKPTTTSSPTTTSRPTTTPTPPRSNSSSTSIPSSTSISSTGTNNDSSSSTSASPSPFATYPDRIMVQLFNMYVMGNVSKYSSFIQQIHGEMAYVMGIPTYRINVTNVEVGDPLSFITLVLYPDWYDISSSTSQLSSLTTSFIQKLNTTLTMNNTTWLKTVNVSTLKTETTYMYLCNDWYYFTCDIIIELSSSSVATVPIGGVIAAVVISLIISLALVIGFLYAYFRSTHGDVSAKALRSMVQREGSAVFTHTTNSFHPFNSFKSGGKTTFGLGPHRTGAAAVQLTSNIFTPPVQHTTPTTTTHSGSMTISPLPTTRTLPATNTKTTMSTDPGATSPVVSSPSLTSASHSLNVALVPGLTSSNDIDNYS